MKLGNVETSKLFAVCGVLGGVVLFVAPFIGRENVGQLNNEPASSLVGLADDWTHRHVVFTHSDSPEVVEAMRHDPRFWLQQLKRGGAQSPEAPELLRSAPLAPSGIGPVMPWPRGPRPQRNRVDWNVSLGASGARVADGMYPAKFTFAPIGAPDCTNDFVVFALDLGSSATQAGIAAFNNLYTNASGTGFCAGTAPTVKWAYNTTSGGAITTSPVLSLNGTKVAYVEDGSPPAFHVLTPGSGGTIASPLSGTGVDVRVSYGATGDTRSSPFVDYLNDVAYVAADDGKLYKFTGVFNGTPTLVTTGGWPLTIAAGGNSVILTSPVLDPVTQRVFIGDGNGSLHLVRLSASDPCTGSVAAPCVDSTNVALSGGTHPLIDGPIVDSTNQKVFAFMEGNAGGSYSVTQATTLLGSAVTVPVGANTAAATGHIGAFDDAYFTSGPSSGHLYVCGTLGSGSSAASPSVWRIGFTGSTLNSTPSDGPLQLVTSGAQGCSPLTTFHNPNVGPSGTEFLFVSVTANCSATITGGCIRAFDITGGFPTGTTGTGVITLAEGGGTSGIVVDNVSTLAQAASIYFSNLADTSNKIGANAIKLTQSGLQ